MPPPPPWLLLLLLTTSITTTTSTDLTTLLSLRSTLRGRTLFWNTTSTTPCTFQGVSCDPSTHRVTALHLPAASLSGQIPLNSISTLSHLHTLSLRFNRLSGPIPSDISNLTRLRSLYLQGNTFSGPIPDSLFAIHSLVKLDLGSNSFSGRIPLGFNQLSKLQTLLLNNNSFTGVLPDIRLPKLEHFNVSFNALLNGSVPLGLRENPDSSFLGTSICGKPLDTVCSDVVDELAPAPAVISAPIVVDGDEVRKRRKESLSGGAIAGIVIACVVGLFLVLLVLFILCRKRNVNGSRSVGIETIKYQGNAGGDMPIVVGEAKSDNAIEPKKLMFFGNVAREFDLEELLRASAEVLGKGTYGTTYKAVLEVGAAVAVKRLRDVMISEREFREKVVGVGAMDHQNLLPLKAYYYSRDEKLLIFDYMSMGSLSAILHGNKGTGHTPLNWEFRSRIALGAAHGIEYLHSQGQYVVHGDIKSSNVLLTKSNEPRLSDFGLYQLVGPSSSPTRASGYRAPEVMDPRNVSQKADVYSFGVLLLELLTGKAPTHALMADEGVDLPRWVQSIVTDEWTSEIFDSELTREQSAEEEMVQLLQLGIDCTGQHPDTRPSITQIVRRIEEICRSSLLYNQEQPDHVSETD